jgi:hypothetical protein
VQGAQEWNGKFTEFIRTTTYDKELGYPLSAAPEESHDTTLDTNTPFDNTTENPLTYDSYADLHGV